MGDKEFSSVEEIDAALEEEFKLGVEEEKEPSDDVKEGDETEDEDDEDYDEFLDEDEIEFEDDDEKPEPNKDEPKKPNRGDKEAYAFAKLREEKALAEQKAQREEAFMKKLAKASGYGDDVDAYRKDLESKLIEQQAKQQGLTPEVYKELADAKAKLEAYEKDRIDAERMAKSQNFLKTVNRVLKGYDVDSKEVGRELFKTLEDAGYTIDTLLSVPNPEFLIRGALHDKLAKAERKETRISDGLDTKRIKSSSASVKTIDELIDEEMVQYAKSRGIKYNK